MAKSVIACFPILSASVSTGTSRLLLVLRVGALGSGKVVKCVQVEETSVCILLCTIVRAAFTFATITFGKFQP